jgi:hypothetical protein
MRSAGDRESPWVLSEWDWQRVEAWERVLRW